MQRLVHRHKDEVFGEQVHVLKGRGGSLQNQLFACQVQSQSGFRVAEQAGLGADAHVPPCLQLLAQQEKCGSLRVSHRPACISQPRPTHPPLSTS